MKNIDLEDNQRSHFTLDSVAVGLSNKPSQDMANVDVNNPSEPNKVSFINTLEDGAGRATQLQTNRSDAAQQQIREHNRIHMLYKGPMQSDVEKEHKLTVF